MILAQSESFIPYFTGMLYAIASCMSVCPSVCFHHNWGMIRRRMMKFGTYILEVKSNIEFEYGSRTWPLTRSNWRFSKCTFRVHVRLHNVHVHFPTPVEYCLCVCATVVYSTYINTICHASNQQFHN